MQPPGNTGHLHLLQPLVPTKISSAGSFRSPPQLAGRHAAYLAKATGAELLGVYVVDTHAAMRLGIYYGEAVREMEQEGTDALDDMGKLSEAAGVKFTDLIVMGSHGQSRLERVLLGSVLRFTVLRRPVQHSGDHQEKVDTHRPPAAGVTVDHEIEPEEGEETGYDKVSCFHNTSPQISVRDNL